MTFRDADNGCLSERKCKSDHPADVDSVSRVSNPQAETPEDEERRASNRKTLIQLLGGRNENENDEQALDRLFQQNLKGNSNVSPQALREVSDFLSGRSTDDEARTRFRRELSDENSEYSVALRILRHGFSERFTIVQLTACLAGDQSKILEDVFDDLKFAIAREYREWKTRVEGARELGAARSSAGRT